MIKVLVADDQLLIRIGLAALIRATPDLDLVGEASCGEEAVRLAAETEPDVILMDVRMPGMDGIAATERIVADAPSGRAPRILMLTTFDIDEYVYHALRAGASGFLLKETSPERLMAAIRTVFTGDVLLSPSSTRRLIEAFRPQQPTPDPALDRLTPRETQVLTLVGRALTNGDIAKQLHLSEATVKSHLNHAMSKLGLSSRVQVVSLAYDAGLVVPGWNGT